METRIFLALLIAYLAGLGRGRRAAGERVEHGGNLDLGKVIGGGLLAWLGGILGSL